MQCNSQISGENIHYSVVLLNYTKAKHRFTIKEKETNNPKCLPRSDFFYANQFLCISSEYCFHGSVLDFSF